MTTPAISKGDLLLVTAGPGMLSTALALVGVASGANHGERPRGERLHFADGLGLRGRSVRPFRGHHS